MIGLEHIGNPCHIYQCRQGDLLTVRRVIRSVNDSGPDGPATVGCGQAKGSPKGAAPTAEATQLRKQAPTSSPRRQVKVHSDGLAPKAISRTPRTGPLRASLRAVREWSYVLGSGFHQRPSTRTLRGLLQGSARFSSACLALPKISGFERGGVS